jgi:hypothetical protein
MPSVRATLLPALAAAALLAGAGAAAAQSPDDRAALRRMLAAQPDYAATSTTVMYAGDHAFGGKSKIARLGKRRYEDNGSAVFLSEPGRPTVKVYRERKQYAELPPGEGHEAEFEPEALAARGDVTFRLLGTEKVGGHEALKIEATVPVGPHRELRAVFYAAPGLKNLVVKQEYFAGEHPLVMSFLEGVSLEVPGELFAVPAGYTKVIEEAPPDDPAGGLLKELGKPAAEKARPPKSRRH